MRGHAELFGDHRADERDGNADDRSDKPFPVELHGPAHDAVPHPFGEIPHQFAHPERKHVARLFHDRNGGIERVLLSFLELRPRVLHVPERGNRPGGHGVKKPFHRRLGLVFSLVDTFPVTLDEVVRQTRADGRHRRCTHHAESA